MTLTDLMCQEKTEQEDSPAFKIMLMHWYKDSKTTLKNTVEDWLKRPETIKAAQV